MVVCGDAGDGLGDSLYEAEDIYVRGEIQACSAPMPGSSRMTEDVDLAAVGELLAAAQDRPTASRNSNVSLPPARSTTGTQTPTRLTDGPGSRLTEQIQRIDMHPQRPPVMRTSRPRTCSSRRARASDRQVYSLHTDARRRPACMKFAALGAKRRSCRTSTTSCSSGRRCHATRSRATARNAHRRPFWHALRETPDRVGHADYHRRHELRCPFRRMWKESPRAGLPRSWGPRPRPGMAVATPEEWRSSKTLVHQCLPSRYGFKPMTFRKADAIEICHRLCGAKPGGRRHVVGSESKPAGWPRCARFP